MMVTSHALIGAAVGEAINQPILAFIFMAFFHLAMDKVPHFWPKKQGKLFTIIDVLACGSVLLSILLFQPPNFVSVFAGAFGGIFVDVIFVGIPMVKKSKYGHWQHNRQFHSHNIWYLLTDLIAILIGLFFWLR